MKTRKIKVPLVGMKVVKNGVTTRISKVIDAISFEIEMSPYRVFGIHEFEEVQQNVSIMGNIYHVWQEEIDDALGKNRDAKDTSAMAIYKRLFNKAKKNRISEDMSYEEMKTLSDKLKRDSNQTLFPKGEISEKIKLDGRYYTCTPENVERLREYEKNRDAEDEDRPELLHTIANTRELAERSKTIELLEKYSFWLTKHGYMDTDWKDEPPYAIDEFLNSNK